MAENPTRTLISLPRTIKRDEVFEIKTLIAHPMETGYRPGADGAILPRDLIRNFSCHFDDGEQQILVFAAQLHPAVSANPYLAFAMRAHKSGKLKFSWQGDRGFEKTETVELVLAS